MIENYLGHLSVKELGRLFGIQHWEDMWNLAGMLEFWHMGGASYYDASDILSEDTLVPCTLHAGAK